CIGQIPIRKTDDLVEHGQGIAQTTISYLRNHVKFIFFIGHPLFIGNMRQMSGHILHLDPIEIKDLTTRYYCRQNLVLFGCRKDENSIRRWLLQRFQKSIEGLLREHMHLIDNINLVPTRLWRNSHLLNQSTDILDGIVGGRIKFVNTERGPVLKGNTAIACSTRLNLAGNLLTIDCLCQNTCTSRLTYPPRSTKQKSLCQLIVLNRIFEGVGNMLLPYYRIKCNRTVFTCRDNEIIH